MHDITVLQSCGTNGNGYYLFPLTRSCSGLMPSSYFGSSTRLVSSIYNSASVGQWSYYTGWKTAELCSSTGTACSANGNHNYIVNAVTNGAGTIGIGTIYKSTVSTLREYFSTSGSRSPYLAITYSGGSDSIAPTDEFVPYTGVTSYMEGTRTFFTTIKDASGIDTTASGAPHFYMSLNNQAYVAYKATTIGTCGSSDKECQFRVTTPSISAGDDVEYFWAYQDGASSPNMVTNPAGGTGTPSSATTPSSVYSFSVEDPANAGNEMKLTVLATKVRTYSSSDTTYSYDRQMTYYADSDEYVFEFDTSDCGTGTSSCFYTTRASTSYTNWQTKWTANVPSSTWGLAGRGAPDGLTQTSDFYGGYLSISAKDGPGMNLIFLYDSTSNDFAMVGVGDATTGITEPLNSGTSAMPKTTTATNKYFVIPLPSNLTGTFAKFDWGGTTSTARANWMCAGSGGIYYFFRSTSSNPTCTVTTSRLFGSSAYAWSGFAFGVSTRSAMASSGEMTYMVSKVAPEPDTAAPTVDHRGLMDSHARDRTFSFVISDRGAPPSGVDTTATEGVGPTMYYRITDADGTQGNWVSTLLNPSDARANCALSACTWSVTLEDLERDSQLEYYMEARDVSTVAAGVNTVTTSTTTFEVGDPTKIFVVEWHDAQYRTSTSNRCTFQVLMYDVTNEIEFKYDTNCLTNEDYSTVGYMDQTRKIGATLREEAGFLGTSVRTNVFDTNYRISTDGTSHSWESFDLGLTELPTYDVAIQGFGTTVNDPSNYQCTASRWAANKAYCNANIDLPEGFVFDYFGTEYNGSNATDRVHIARMGAMALANDGILTPKQSLSTWNTNMNDLPYDRSTY